MKLGKVIVCSNVVYLPLFDPNIPFLSIFRIAYMHLPLLTYIWPYLDLITLIWSYLLLIALILPYVPYSPNICILHFKEFGDAESVDKNAVWVFI